MKTAERTFKTWDGAELFYRAWLPEDAPQQWSGSRTESRKALLLFHRGHEHSGRWQETVAQLGLDDVSVFAWDARGHGASPGERGSAENLAVIIKDVNSFVRHVASEHHIAIEDMILMAHSVGAVTVAAWVHDYAPPIRAMILATPAFRVKLYVPFAVPLLRLKQKLCGNNFVKSYVKATMLTHDPGQTEQYRVDPLIFRQIATNILLDLHDTSTRLLADAGAIRVPTLILSAGSDWVVKNSAPRSFFERLSSPKKELETFDGFHHAIFHEKGRSKVLDRVRRFCREQFETSEPNHPAPGVNHTDYTWREYNQLCAPGSFRFKAVKAAAKLGGLFSEGLKLGWRTGFDSGLTLDYVYENRPRGLTWLGRAIDKSYLNSIGWRGIRQRKAHLQKIARETILRLHSEGREVRILDIAAGPGRYLLETIRSLPAQIRPSALLRDYKAENVKAARELAQRFGLKEVKVMAGDAFDRASLVATSPRPTIGIVSGLYELFPENEPVLSSLRALAEVIQPGGYLLYTNQPWHPQLEFIARVLRNREGRPWIMRRRTQAEMDELVQAAGFEKLDMEIDQWGIFSVSLARRTPVSVRDRDQLRAETLAPIELAELAGAGMSVRSSAELMWNASHSGL